MRSAPPGARNVVNDPIFRRPSNPLPLAAVAAHGQAELPASVDPAVIVDGVAPLATARRGELTVAQGEAALEDLRATRAGACFVLSRHRDYVPRGTVALVTQDPLRAFLNVAALIDPGVRRPGLWRGSEARHPTAIVHAEARVEPGAVIGPGAVLGPRAEIGGGTSIGANCFIDADVRIGRGCSIGPNVTVSHALVGDEVIVRRWGVHRRRRNRRARPRASDPAERCRTRLQRHRGPRRDGRYGGRGGRKGGGCRRRCRRSDSSALRDRVQPLALIIRATSRVSVPSPCKMV